MKQALIDYITALAALTGYSSGELLDIFNDGLEIMDTGETFRGWLAEFTAIAIERDF